MVHILDLNFRNFPYCIASFVIQSGKSTVLVETGPYSCIQALESGLKGIGMSVDQIDAVFISHIHFDHAGSSWYFAQKNKKIYLHPKGFRHLAHPEKLIESARRIYLDKMDELWGTIKPINEAMLVQVQDGETVTIGDITMTAHYTPGHAKHHITWQFEKSLFTGDVAGCRILNGPPILPTPPPDLNYEEWVASIQKMIALRAESLYLTHYGKYDDTDVHFDRLRKQLDYLFELTEICTANDPDGNVPEALLNGFYHAHYAAYSLRKEATAAYANIAPDWMNAQGLKRYWLLKHSSN